MCHQRGAALLVTMIFLLIITVIAISSLSNINLQTSMLANSQRKQLTFQEAESAIDRNVSQNDSVMSLSSGLQSGGCDPDNAFNETEYTALNTDYSSDAKSYYLGKRANLNATGSIRMSGGQSSGAGSAGVVYIVDVIGDSTFNQTDIKSVIHQGIEFEGSDKFCDKDF